MRKPPPRNPQVHGGRAADMAMATGVPLTGMGALEAIKVSDELEVSGAEALFKAGAIRLIAAARLWWEAYQAAVDRGDLQAMVMASAKHGWHENNAQRSLALLMQIEKGARIDATAVLEAIHGDDK